MLRRRVSAFDDAKERASFQRLVRRRQEELRSGLGVVGYDVFAPSNREKRKTKSLKKIVIFCSCFKVQRGQEELRSGFRVVGNDVLAPTGSNREDTKKKKIDKHSFTLFKVGK